MLPAKWGHLHNLEMLNLRDNNLRGALPAEWGHLGIAGNNTARRVGRVNGLRLLNLAGNSLTGALPEWGAWTVLGY